MTLWIKCGVFWRLLYFNTLVFGSQKVNLKWGKNSPLLRMGFPFSKLYAWTISNLIWKSQLTLEGGRGSQWMTLVGSFPFLERLDNVDDDHGSITTSLSNQPSLYHPSSFDCSSLWFCSLEHIPGVRPWGHAFLIWLLLPVGAEMLHTKYEFTPAGLNGPLYWWDAEAQFCKLIVGPVIKLLCSKTFTCRQVVFVEKTNVVSIVGQHTSILMLKWTRNVFLSKLPIRWKKSNPNKFEE